MIEIDLSKNVLEECVLKSAQGTAILFGLTSNRLIWSDVTNKSHSDPDAKFQVLKAEKHRGLASFYLILVEGEPAGSIISIDIASGLTHLVGMYVKEELRGAAFRQENSKDRVVSPAACLLSSYISDMANSGKSITLEVMNYNIAALKLYEKRFSTLVDGEEKHLWFSLLSQTEISYYGRIRGKKLGRWHEIKLDSGHKGMGIQWRHTPDYAGQSTWSISRVYGFNLDSETLLELSKPKSRVRSYMNLFKAVFAGGKPIRYLLWRSIGK